MQTIAKNLPCLTLDCRWAPDENRGRPLSTAHFPFTWTTFITPLITMSECKTVYIYYYVVLLALNPLRLTRQWTDTHFCWFLTVLEYSPIGEKFLPTIAPRTLTLFRKKRKIFKTFFVLKVLMHPINFDVKICFLIVYKTYIEYIFCFFYFGNIIRDYCMTIWEKKKLKIQLWNFFLTVHFHVFF